MLVLSDHDGNKIDCKVQCIFFKFWVLLLRPDYVFPKGYGGQRNECMQMYADIFVAFECICIWTSDAHFSSVGGFCRQLHGVDNASFDG